MRSFKGVTDKRGDHGNWRHGGTFKTAAINDLNALWLDSDT